MHIYTATNPAPSSHIPVGLNFCFLFLRAKFRNGAMLFLSFSTLISVVRGYSAWQFEMFCDEEKWDLFTFNTYSRIFLCASAHYVRYVEGKHQLHLKAFSDFYNFVLVT